MTWHDGQLIDRRKWARVRLVVLERDGWRCRTCGKAGRLEVDHVTPLHEGGAVFDLSNLQTLCKRCHFRKSCGERRKREPSPDAERWRQLVADRLQYE